MSVLNYNELRREFYRKEKVINKRYGSNCSGQVSHKKQIERDLIANKNFEIVRKDAFWKYLMQESSNN